MIARFWSAKSTELRSKDYLDHFNNVVLPQLRQLDGYVGSTVLSRGVDGDVEILVATIWRSLEAIEQFAGRDFERAVVAADAAVVLTEYDRRVRHFDVAITDLPYR